MIAPIVAVRLFSSSSQAFLNAAPNWRMWLAAAGVEGVDTSRGPRFSLETLTMAAAIEGQGVALVSGALVQHDIAAGRLARPFPETRRSGRALYVTQSAAAADAPADSADLAAE